MTFLGPETFGNDGTQNLEKAVGETDPEDRDDADAATAEAMLAEIDAANTNEEPGEEGADGQKVA